MARFYLSPLTPLGMHATATETTRTPPTPSSARHAAPKPWKPLTVLRKKTHNKKKKKTWPVEFLWQIDTACSLQLCSPTTMVDPVGYWRLHIVGKCGTNISSVYMTRLRSGPRLSITTTGISTTGDKYTAQLQWRKTNGHPSRCRG